jgi:hypothetical protein
MLIFRRVFWEKGGALLWANFTAMMMLGGILLPMAVKEHPKIKAKYPDTWLSTGVEKIL